MNRFIDCSAQTRCFNLGDHLPSFNAFSHSLSLELREACRRGDDFIKVDDALQSATGSCSSTTASSESIILASGLLTPNMRLDHCRRLIAMPQQILHGADVAACLQQTRRGGMPKCAARSSFPHSTPRTSLSK
jgi:hypothetical protein